jgi:hypothetical protein
MAISIKPGSIFGNRQINISINLNYKEVSLKRVICITVLCIVFFIITPAFAAKGVVAYRQSGCMYFLAETTNGFALLQWLGGAYPLRGNIIVGDFETYGLKEIYNSTQDSKMKVLVESFWMSESRAMEKYRDKCN